MNQKAMKNQVAISFVTLTVTVMSIVMLTPSSSQLLPTDQRLSEDLKLLSERLALWAIHEWGMMSSSDRHWSMQKLLGPLMKPPGYFVQGCLCFVAPRQAPCSMKQHLMKDGSIEECLKIEEIASCSPAKKLKQLAS